MNFIGILGRDTVLQFASGNSFRLFIMVDEQRFQNMLSIPQRYLPCTLHRLIDIRHEARLATSDSRKQFLFAQPHSFDS